MKKKSFLLYALVIFSVLFNSNLAISQENEDEALEEYETVIYQDGIAFVNRELKRRQDKERDETEKRLQKERQDLFKRLDSEYGSLKDKIEEEKKLFLERENKEIEELRKRQEEEQKAEVKENKIYKRYLSNSREGFSFNKRNLKTLARTKLQHRIEKIKHFAKLPRYIEVLSSEDDPLIITDAIVRKTKTEFLGIKDVDLNYKVVIHNQTPKIIDIASFTWERIEPFTNRITAISRETKFSKPLIPYEERTIEYNELDNLRNGEYYRVKISNVIFEDGSQWKNPVVADKHF